MAETIANFVRVRLTAAIDNLATSLTVAAPVAPYKSPPDVTTGDQARLTLMDDFYSPQALEIIIYTGRTDNGDGTYTLTGLTRGAEGTTAQSWQTTAEVIQPLTAGTPYVSRWPTPTEVGAAAASHTHVLAEVTDAGALAALDDATAADIDSGVATAGYALVADGAGGATWEQVASGTGSTNLGATADTVSVTVTSDTGTDAVIAAADSLKAGAMSVAHNDKLAGIESNATADQTASEIKTAYESNADTNAFNDVEQTKLSHIAVTQAVDLDAIELRVNGLDAAVVLAGAWDASLGSFPAATDAGQSYIVSAAGTVDGIAFVANDRIVAITDAPSTSIYAGNWLKLDYSDLVTSVAGRTGAISLVVGDITDAGTMATQNANAVLITGGSMGGVGITPEHSGSAGSILYDPDATVIADHFRSVHNLVAYRRTNASPTTGAIVFLSPVANERTMVQVRIAIDQHVNAGGLIQLLAARCYTNTGLGSSPNTTGKVVLAGTPPSLRFGFETATGKLAIILGDTASSWNWLCAVIEHAMFHHDGLNNNSTPDAFCRGWTSLLTTDLSGYQNLVTV